MKSSAALLLHSPGNPVHHLNAHRREITNGGFSAQHDRVSLLEHGISHIGDLRTRRVGLIDHTLKHMRSHNHRFTNSKTFAYDVSLNNGQFLIWAFHTQITAGHHDGIGCLNNAANAFHGVLILDLSHHFGGVITDFN